MKKRIWIALLPVTLLWCGCTEAENKYEHAREITAVASASDVIVSQSTRAAIEGTRFDGKSARVLATATEGGYSELHCNGIMTFEGEEDVARYSPGWRGNNSFPETGDPTIWLSGLYPAEGWVGITDGDAQTDFPTIDGATVTHTLDGKTDLMYAPEDDTKRDGHAELTFDHLLTLLNIKLIKVGTAEITVKKITLVKTAGDADGKLNTVCSVALNTPAVTFSSNEIETITELPCWRIDTDDKFEDQEEKLKRTDKPDDEVEATAYILAPPLTADQVGGVDKVKDYTLEVVFDCGGDALTQEVDLNLKKEENEVETDYDAPTAGCSFDITLKFSIGDISATAKITGWDRAGEDVDMLLPPLPIEATPQGNTGAIDELTNCYMVKPGKELVFPVKRAYVYDENEEDFTTTLRSTGEEYELGFRVKVLWKDADVILVPPMVIGTGKDALVWVRTKKEVQGNASVAVINNQTDEIVWSYHIWVTDYDPTIPAPVGTTEIVYDTYTHQIFNVDLGDMGSGPAYEIKGLVYQWGRKDPFRTDDTYNEQEPFSFYHTAKEGVSPPISWGIKNPTVLIAPLTNSWIFDAEQSTDGWIDQDGTRKSLYDPCPFHSRVHKFNVDGEETDINHELGYDLWSPTNALVQFRNNCVMYRVRKLDANTVVSTGSVNKYRSFIGFKWTRFIDNKSWSYTHTGGAWGLYGWQGHSDFRVSMNPGRGGQNPSYVYNYSNLPVRCSFLK